MRRSSGSCGVAPSPVAPSPEDAETLTNNLLLLSALMLAFAVTLHTGTFSRDDIMEGEARYQKFKQLQLCAGKDSGYMSSKQEECLAREMWDHGDTNGPLLYRLVQTGYVCVTMNCCAMILGTVVSLSMSYGSSRENPEVFKKWFAHFRWILLMGYGFMIGGIISFFELNHVAVFTVYLAPYSRNAVWNSTAGRMTDVVGEQFYEGGDTDAISVWFKNGFIIILVVCFTCVLFLHVHVHFKNGFKGFVAHLKQNLSASAAKPEGRRIEVQSQVPEGTE